MSKPLSDRRDFTTEDAALWAYRIVGVAIWLYVLLAWIGMVPA